jgi:hypothetical protein
MCAEGLTAASATVDAELDRLQRAWPAAIDLRCERDTDFYALPAWFLPAFPGVRDDGARALFVFCRLCAGATLLQDHVVDGDGLPADVAPRTMRIMAMQTEATLALMRVLPPTRTVFWGRFRDHVSRHTGTWATERSFADGRPWSEYTTDVGLDLARSKHCLADIVVAAMADLAGDDELYAPICASIGALGAAAQMVDDLEDWRDDLRRRQPSILLTRVLDAAPGADLGADGWRALEARVARTIYYRGHADRVLGLAMTLLDEADQLTARAPGLPWYGVTAEVRRRCSTLRGALSAVVADQLAAARGRSRAASSAR